MTSTSTIAPTAPALSKKKLPWYRKLGMQVLVSLILGIIVGFAFPKFASQLKLLGDMSCPSSRSASPRWCSSPSCTASHPRAT